MSDLDRFFLGMSLLGLALVAIPFILVGYRYFRAKYSKADLIVEMRDDKGRVVEKFKIDYYGRITPIIERKNIEDESI